MQHETQRVKLLQASSLVLVPALCFLVILAGLSVTNKPVSYLETVEMNFGRTERQAKDKSLVRSRKVKKIH